MQFIPNYACYVSKAVDPLVCDRSVNDKNNFREAWQLIKKFIPQKIGNKEYLTYDVFFYKRSETTDKEIYYSLRNIKQDITEVQLNVILFCSFCSATVRFYDLKNQGKVFLNPNANYFDVRVLPGDLVYFMPEIPYQQSVVNGENYYFFFKVYYSGENSNNAKEQQNKNSKKKEIFMFQTPTPNGLKFAGASIRSWEQVYKDDKNEEGAQKNKKKLKIQLADSPLFVDCRKGRTPIKYKEDYCPNCYEILPLPYKYGNCSGCLYPIIN